MSKDKAAETHLKMNGWGEVISRKIKQTIQMFLRLFSKTYCCESLSILTGIQNIPRNPLRFSSHWRIESKHRSGTVLTKARWEEVLHSKGRTLVILAYSSFHTSRVWEDKELCLGQFLNPSISIGLEWTPLSGKAFCPRKYHSATWAIMPPGTLQYVFQRTFPWGKRKI